MKTKLSKRMLLGIAVAMVLGLAAAFPFLRSETADELTAVEIERSNCPNAILGMKQAKSWYQGAGELLIEANYGCGSLGGRKLSLSQVVLTVRDRENRVRARMSSSEGEYFVKQGKIMVTVEHDLTQGKCLGQNAGRTLLIDVKQGMIRAPGVLIDLKDPQALNC